ncbi:response regulator [Congregibacter variabilis]|uniref:Response regulator n=1 Tax=Congregibacter variabilis TaxID=3081200 RepID=A0ABZ0I708_9GAMM|nr:response regulator [Congregibacter sp. IMCC43200]
MEWSLGYQPEYDALIVENELDFRSELIYFIEALDVGISVAAEASNFDDAKARLDQGDIDLLITDINLTDSPRFKVGDRDGLELAAYAKDTFDIPAVFLTAFADFDPAVFNLAAACEPVGFIQKNGNEIDGQTRAHMGLAVRRLESIRRERESSRQLSDISSHFGSAKLYVDKDGLVYDFNCEACSLLERSPQDLVNHHWEDLVSISPSPPAGSHPLSRAFESGEPLFLPAVAINLPENGLLLASALVIASEHLRRSCTILLLNDHGKTTRDFKNWELDDGNCLVFIGTSPALEHSALDLAIDARAVMLELYSGVLARLPSSVTVSILKPKTLAVILEATSEAAGQSLISTFIIDMEVTLAKRHPGLRLHAGLAHVQAQMSVKDVMQSALTGLEKAQHDPVKRVHSANS